MAAAWIGYRPKADVEGLIISRKKDRIEHASAITIQCLIRMKKAWWVYLERRRHWLINFTIPRFQACWRGKLDSIFSFFFLFLSNLLI